MADANRQYSSWWTRVIAETTDHDTAMRFALAFGGRRVVIPQTASEDGALVGAVGLDAAKKISARLSDQRFDVGLETENLILWLRAQGKSEEDISNTVRRSRRTVQYHLTGTTPKHPGFTPESVEDQSEPPENSRAAKKVPR